MALSSTFILNGGEDIIIKINIRGRPLCVIATCVIVILIVLVVPLKVWDTQEASDLEQIFGPRDQVTIVGLVYDRELKNNSQVLHIKKLVINRDNSNVFSNSKLLLDFASSIDSYPKTKPMSAIGLPSYNSSLHSICNNVFLPVGGKVVVHLVDENIQVKIGDYVKVSGTIDFYEEERNPGNFNQRHYYHKQGIYGYVWPDSVEVIKESSSVYYTLRDKLNNLKYAWKDMLVGNLSEEHGGMLSAMLLGEKSTLDRELKLLFQRSGIGHILTISGLHMSFIGIGLYSLLRRMGGSFAVSGVASIFVLLLYVLMIGLGVSSFRAITMFVIKIGAEILGRNYDGPNSLAIASMLVLCWRPAYILDVGFLLSFGAVLSIVVILPVLEGIFISKIEKKIIKNIKKGFLLNISINLILLPIILYFFFEFPLYSILANLIVVPLLSFVLGFGILGSFAFVFVPVIGKMILKLCEMIIRGYEIICEVLTRLPGSRIVTGQPSIWQILTYYLLLAGLLAFIVRKSGEKNEQYN